MSGQTFDPLTMPLDGIRLIQASAGTGKTFSLAGIYLRLIVEEQLSVREILVMTFTQAATKELRERIRRRLVAAARVAARPETVDRQNPEEVYADAVIGASAEDRSALARRLADAANAMDEATITTIHGFSHKASAENAFDSALPFDRGEQVDDRAVFTEALADYWRSRALGQNPEPGFQQLWPTPAALGLALKGMRDRPHARLAGPPPHEITTIARRAHALWTQSHAQFEREWRACWDDDALLRNKSLFKAIDAHDGIHGALDALRLAFAEGHPLPGLPKWVAELTDAGLQFKKKQLARGERLLGDPLAKLLRRLRPLVRLAMLREAHWQICAMAASRKRARRQFSFADMISALHTAIAAADTGPRLADALNTTWPWALVDEFQDTDPHQYEILRATYAGRPRGGMLLIGDPKQAIYGFRGGDVFAYLAAARDAGDRAYQLDTNFRSTQALLDGVEALFQTPSEDEFLVEGIGFHHVKAGRTAGRQLWLQGTPRSPLTLWHMTLDGTRKQDAEGACRAACVDEICKLLNPANRAAIRADAAATIDERALEPRDIAVLVNTNVQAADLQRALSRAGVAAVCINQQSVFESEEALELMHLLKAVADPTAEGTMRGALTTTLLGARLGDIVALSQDDIRWQAEIERFQQAYEVWNSRGVLAMLTPLIQQAAGRALSFFDGERRMSNYLQLAELLSEAESATFGMSGLLRWLHQKIIEAADGGAGDAEQLRLETDEALVRIVTVHRSKGLEYPVVFLPFAPWLGAMGKPAELPHAYHDDQGNALVDTVGSDASAARSVRESRAEALRVLYVALTRAEIACIFPWGVANGTADSALASLLHRDSVDTTMWYGSKSTGPLQPAAVRERLADIATRAPHAVAVVPMPEPAGPRERLATPGQTIAAARSDLPEVRPAWSSFSFSRLARHAGPGPEVQRAADETVDLETAPILTGTALPDLPGGTAFGSAVHALLETAQPQDWPAPGGRLPDARSAEVAAALQRFGIPLPAGAARTVLLARTADLVRGGLHTPLGSLGPLARLPTTARRVELEFVFRLRGAGLARVLECLNDFGYAPNLARDHQLEQLRGLMHGYIDLVAEKDGIFYVIDYKTNWLGPYAEHYHAAQMQDAVRHHHYDLQYLIYLTALHRFLMARLPDYDPHRHLGGAFYLFLRGMSPGAGGRGVYFDRPDPELIKALDQLFDRAVEAA